MNRDIHLELMRTKRDKIRLLVARGWSSGEIARKLAPNNSIRQRRIRSQVRQIISTDTEIQNSMGASAHGAMIESLPDITDALIRRALRGRPDAIKLVFEASGFHNPRVDHRHSGDVKLTVSMPRPERAELDSPPPSRDDIEGTAEDVA